MDHRDAIIDFCRLRGCRDRSNVFDTADYSTESRVINGIDDVRFCVMPPAFVAGSASQAGAPVSVGCVWKFFLERIHIRECVSCFCFFFFNSDSTSVILLYSWLDLPWHCTGSRPNEENSANHIDRVTEQLRHAFLQSAAPRVGNPSSSTTFTHTSTPRS